jgi:hypothetical protein
MNTFLADQDAPLKHHFLYISVTQTELVQTHLKEELPLARTLQNSFTKLSYF